MKLYEVMYAIKLAECGLWSLSRRTPKTRRRIYLRMMLSELGIESSATMLLFSENKETAKSELADRLGISLNRLNRLGATMEVEVLNTITEVETTNVCMKEN